MHHMSRRLSASCLAVVFAAIAGTGAAQGATVVAPSSYSSTYGGTYQLAIFGNGGDRNTFQELFSAALLSDIPIGSLITSVGYRSTASDPASQYSSFDIELGSSTKTLGNLSTDLASNQGADTQLVRTGALSVPAGPLGGGDPSDFYSIMFQTPFVYRGGDLLLQTSFTGGLNEQKEVDAIPADTSMIDTAADLGDGLSFAHIFNAPVVSFSYGTATAAVPEPASWALMLGGFGLIGGMMRTARRSDDRFTRRLRKLAA